MEEIQKSQTLAEIPIGEEAVVLAISDDSPVSKRLMEMGIVPGVSVRVIKSAPFGSPLEIQVRGYHLALRKSEAETIKVQSPKSQN